jgi:hypothetical protein
MLFRVADAICSGQFYVYANPHYPAPKLEAIGAPQIRNPPHYFFFSSFTPISPTGNRMPPDVDDMSPIHLTSHRTRTRAPYTSPSPPLPCTTSSLGLTVAWGSSSTLEQSACDSRHPVPLRKSPVPVSTAPSSHTDPLARVESGSSCASAITPAIVAER